jgi:glucosylceramidase
MGTLPFSTSELEIASMRNWASAVALWNVALDQNGGPVQPPNAGCSGCTAIVTIDDTTHTVTFTRDYYQLGQVSKFLAPGAVRIGSNNFVSYRYIPTGVAQANPFATPGLDDVAFQNPDGSRVLVAYNSATTPIKFAARDDGYYFNYTLEPGATATFIWKALAGRAPLGGAPHARLK